MIKILPLKLEYCERVAEIAKECLPEHWSLDGVRSVLLYDNNIYYVAMDLETSEIVAFAGIMIIADEAELLNIAVTKEYQRQGVGEELLEVLFARAKEYGAGRMLLEVRKSNGIARHLYSKNKFLILGEREGYYSNPKENAIVMEKIL